jgi:hypothetical protein
MESFMPEAATTQVCAPSATAYAQAPTKCMRVQLTPYVAYNAPHVKVPPHTAAQAEIADANQR